jgi:RNA polymerase sigma-70 factor, ECF subfamily
MPRYYSDDTKLVEGCVKKDAGAWALFLRKYSGLIFISIDNRLRKYGLRLPPADLEDIKQEVLTRLWKEDLFSAITNRRNISHWLSIVSGNYAIAYMRKIKKEFPARPISISDQKDGQNWADLLDSGVRCPAEEASNNELSERLEAAIEELPAKENLVIKMAVLYGKKHEEISEILGMPAGTVSCYVKRAKEKLREALKDF